MTTNLLRLQNISSRIKKFSILAFSSLTHLLSPTLAKPQVTTYIQVEKTLGVGIASMYGTKSDGFLGKLTASGERLSEEMLTVAHRTLPFGTLLRIINVETGDSVLARVNDRGPFVKGRVLDLNAPTAQALKIDGLGKVEFRKIEYQPN